MRYAEPMTVVPGAHKDIDPDTFQQLHDKKGRPLWNMPKPTGYVEKLQVIQQSNSDPTKAIRLPVKFPVYRGTSAAFARYMRSQIRRAARKAQEQKTDV